MDRTNPPSAHDSAPDWRQMYVAALREPDLEKHPMRIAEAEKALMLRARELSAIGDIDEKQAVNDAFYALQALRTRLQLETNKPDVD
jgi:hypothetical protein